MPAMIDVDIPAGSVGAILASAAVICPHFVGLFLLSAGSKDFTRGCERFHNNDNWVVTRIQLLVRVLPLTALVRVFCAPSLWHYLGQEQNLSLALRSPMVYLWVVDFAVSWTLLLQVVLQPGIRSLWSSSQCIETWPKDCAVGRPYHGLSSTRLHAANGSFFAELLWNAWIIFFARDSASVIGGITVPFVIFNAGMILGGPVNFLYGRPVLDVSVAQTFIFLSIFAVEAIILLNHAEFALPEALDTTRPGIGPLGPYGHWAPWAWNAVVALQAIGSRAAITRSSQLYAGEPWHAGGVDHKEFFLPRFWGLIFFCYGVLVCFNLWVVGNWLMHGGGFSITQGFSGVNLASG